MAMVLARRMPLARTARPRERTGRGPEERSLGFLALLAAARRTNQTMERVKTRPECARAVADWLDVVRRLG